jgi:hypothetical protein
MQDFGQHQEHDHTPIHIDTCNAVRRFLFGKWSHFVHYSSFVPTIDILNDYRHVLLCISNAQQLFGITTSITDVEANATSKRKGSSFRCIVRSSRSKICGVQVVCTKMGIAF